jgi:hypothetical protein
MEVLIGASRSQSYMGPMPLVGARFILARTAAVHKFFVGTHLIP